MCILCIPHDNNRKISRQVFWGVLLLFNYIKSTQEKIEEKIKKMTKKQKFSQMLADNLAYYTANPSGKRCRTTGNCFYHGKTIGKKTKGCFVGALLPVKTRAKLDQYYPEGKSIEDIIGDICDEIVNIELPDYMMEYGFLFSKFQDLHDNDYNWTERGLSKIGKNNLREILDTFSDTLNKTPFRKFL